MTLNPQSETPGWTDGRRRRWSWLRSSFVDVVGNGGTVDAADLNHLPEAHRAAARQVLAEAARLFEQGDRGLAREHAAAGIGAIEQAIDKRWRPPAFEPPTAELLDRIQGRAI